MSLLEKEWFIQAPWGRISIIAWGDCFDPPVLLCHGKVDSAASFRPLLRLLPRSFYYIGLELPGNGKSDPFPPGMMVNAYDMVYVLKAVADHFRWEHFIYIGHSLGTLLGKLYSISYPGKISKLVELDPVAHVFATVEPNEFANWYHHFFTKYYTKYDKYNAGRASAPRYARPDAVEMMKRNRGLGDEEAALVLERISEDLGDGSLRFTFDQRTKLITTPPFSSAFAAQLYTSIATPTLAIATATSVQSGLYNTIPYSLDESAWPNRNFRVRHVTGNHDVHIAHPERVAGAVSDFILYGLEGLDERKAKL